MRSCACFGIGRAAYGARYSTENGSHGPAGTSPTPVPPPTSPQLSSQHFSHTQKPHTQVPRARPCRREFAKQGTRMRRAGRRGDLGQRPWFRRWSAFCRGSGGATYTARATRERGARAWCRTPRRPARRGRAAGFRQRRGWSVARAPCPCLASRAPTARALTSCGATLPSCAPCLRSPCCRSSSRSSACPALRASAPLFALSLLLLAAAALR
eukprot:2733845-Rhodomonas_salina.1